MHGVLFPDIDECLEGVANCSQLCNNTYGSYECVCEPGYMLDEEDNVTCNLSKLVSHSIANHLLQLTLQPTTLIKVNC